MNAFVDAIKAVRSEALQSAAISFGTNIERLKNLAVTPGEVAHQARRDAAWIFYAEYLVTGKIQKPFSPEAQQLPPQVTSKFNELLHNFASELNADQLGYLVETLGVSLINTMLSDTPGMEKSMEALLASLVIGYWTAFETHCADLWIAAVNHGPPQLANRVNLAVGKASPDLDNNMHYDVRKDFGRSMIETEKVSFSSLHDITWWYKITFKGAAKRILNDNPDIAALSAYRNAFVHNAGRADKHFLR